MTFILPGIPNVDDVTEQPWAEDVVTALSDLNSRTTTLEEGGLVNRSFEAAGAEAVDAAGWNKTLGTGSITRQDTVQYDGDWAMKFTRTAGGGNYAGDLTSDQFPWVEGTELEFGAYYKTDAAVASKVTALFFDEDGNPTGTVVIAAATTLTTEWTPVTGTPAIAPAGTRYAALKLEGATADADVSGSAYFDSILLEIKTVNNFGTTGEASTTLDFPITYGTADVWVPDGAATISVTVQLRTTAGGEPAEFRVRIGGNNGTSQVTASTGYVSVTSVITVGAEFGAQTMTLEYGQQLSGGTGSAFITVTASGDLTEENIEVN